MKYYIVTADYRPKNIKKPKYAFRTDKGKGFVRECFGKWYPWLTIYDIRESPENELSEGQRKWAMTI